MDLDQEERVLQHQLAMAEAMKVKPEILDVLRQVSKWEIREWLYICAVDGMDHTRIGKLAAGHPTVASIRKERGEWVTGNRIMDGLRTLEKEVRTVCQESREARAELERNRSEERRRQEKEYEEKLRKQENILSRQRQMIVDLKKQLQTAEDYFASLQKGRSEEDQTPEHETDPEALHSETGKHSLRMFFIRRRKRAAIRKFIQTYLQDDQLSEAQKEYLLICLEEGEKVTDMKAYAVPGLSVEQMKRIRRLRGRRRRHD